mmetsp:Transcript_3475/g.16001  ORF Transcript_3475/g.16001 Transcript_3475/m.16001 type:complete len:311 (+) Transcript_3475:727-1659(+)
MEPDAVVVPSLAQHDEVLACPRCHVAVQLHVNVPEVGAQLYVPFLPFWRVSLHHLLDAFVHCGVAHHRGRERRGPRAGGSHGVGLVRDVRPDGFEPFAHRGITFLHLLAVRRLGVGHAPVRRAVRVPRVRAGLERDVIQRVVRGCLEQAALIRAFIRAGVVLGGCVSLVLSLGEDALRLCSSAASARDERGCRVLRPELLQHALDVRGHGPRVEIIVRAVPTAAPVDLVSLLDVLELVQHPPLQVQWVLERDEIFPRELLVGDQVFPVLGLDAQLVDGLIAVHITGGLDGDDVGAVGEHLVEHRALVIAL